MSLEHTGKTIFPFFISADCPLSVEEPCISNSLPVQEDINPRKVIFHLLF